MSNGLNSFGKKGEKNLLKLKWSTDEKKICNILEKMGFKHTKNEKVLMKNKGKASIFANFQKNDEGEFYLTGSNVDVELMPEFIAFRGFQQHKGMWIDNKTVELKDSVGVTKQIIVIPTSEKAIVEEKEKETKEEKKEIKPKGEDIIAKIKSVVGNDVLEIFGDTGTAKSKFVMAIARNALMYGKRVYYYDTERNISPKEELGDLKYQYNPIYNELLEFATKNLPKNIDIIIIDSIGFPVLYTFAQMSQRQRGDALLGMIAILGALKVWTYKNDALAIVLNQPISEMGVEKNAPRRPFGDKSAFAAKEIWETKDIKKSVDESVFSLTSFRSRDMGYGKEIATITINDNGVKIKWKI